MTSTRGDLQGLLGDIAGLGGSVDVETYKRLGAARGYVPPPG
jgi:hypothetical protein